jgi:hypothetical protein
LSRRNSAWLLAPLQVRQEPKACCLPLRRLRGLPGVHHEVSNVYVKLYKTEASFFVRNAMQVCGCQHRHMVTATQSLTKAQHQPWP